MMLLHWKDSTEAYCIDCPQNWKTSGQETENLDLDRATTSAGVAAVLSDMTLGSYFLIEVAAMISHGCFEMHA